MFRASDGLDAAQTSALPRGGFLAQGLLVALSNPKTLLFFGAFFPQLIDPRGDHALQIVIMGLTALAFAAVSDSAYALLSGRAGRLLSRHRVRLLSRLSRGFLIGGGLWLAFTRHGMCWLIGVLLLVLLLLAALPPSMLYAPSAEPTVTKLAATAVVFPCSGVSHSTTLRAGPEPTSNLGQLLAYSGPTRLVRRASFNSFFYSSRRKTRLIAPSHWTSTVPTSAWASIVT